MSSFTKPQGCIEGSGRCHGIRNSYECMRGRSIIDGQFCRKVFTMDMNRTDQLGPESLEPALLWKSSSGLSFAALSITTLKELSVIIHIRMK